MGFDFHAERSQRVVGDVVVLPQKGSNSGGSKRPLNSWAIRRGEAAWEEGCSIPFDAPYPRTPDGIGRLADEGGEGGEGRFATLLAKASSGPAMDPGRL